MKESIIRLVKRIIFISQMLWFLRIKNRISKFMRSPVSHWLILWRFYSLQWAAVPRLTQHCCTLTHSADVYSVWISYTSSKKYSIHYINDRLDSVSSGLWACGRRANLTLSWRRPLSDWFLYDNGLRHERVKCIILTKVPDV